jgi:HlyD family secretion protein
MKTLLKIILILGAVVAVGAAAYRPLLHLWEEHNRPQWETAEVERGDISAVKNSTGTIEPVLSVSIGTFVSGPIVELNVDFNDEVKQGDLLARVDPRLYQANVDRDQATLATRQAEVERAEALLQQARNKEGRGKKLRAENVDFLSDTEMDALVFEVKSLEAQLKLAKAAVLQARASLANSQANLEYTEIKAPVDGVVIDRKIDPGQTLAAQFQTPELFIVAPDLRKKVHVFAAVDEADIGFIQKAKKENRPVTFTVDAHLDELFEGQIEQIRMSSTETQNVVTYPVVIAASNADLKLLPGMTANISFEVDAKQDVLKIPNAALRFYPNVNQVREQDRGLLDGTGLVSKEEAENTAAMQSAAEKAEAHRNRDRRHVWVVDGNLLRAVEVITGLVENKFSECVSGELKEGDKLVTGIKIEK